MTNPKGRARRARAAAGLVRALLVRALVLACAPLPLLAPPLAAQEGATAVQDVTLSDVVLPLGGTILRAPRLTVSGTRLSRDDLALILRAESAEPWPARLARLDAASITVPVLISERAGPGGSRQTVTYREVTARDVRAGRIAELTAAGAAISLADAQRKGSGTYGRILAGDLDLAALARLYGQPGDGKGAVQRVYATVQIDDVVYTDAGGMTVKVASLKGRDLGGRQVPGGWGGALDALATGLDALAGDDDPSPAERARVAAAAADLVEGVAVGGIEVAGLSVSDADPAGPLLVEVARIAFDAGSATGTLAEGIAVSQGALRARVGRLSLGGLSLASCVAALRRLADPSVEVGDDDLRRLAPTLAAVSLKDMSLDLPQEAAPPRPPEPAKPDSAKPEPAKPAAKPAPPSLGKALDKALEKPAAEKPAAKPETKPDTKPEAKPAVLRVGLRDAALALGPLRDGVPTATRLSLAGLTLPAALADGAPGLGALNGYGYDTLDLDLVLDAVWDEARSEVAVREVSISGREMGSLRLTGTLGGFGPEAFAGGAPAAQLMFSTTAKALDLTVENAGLFERFLKVQSKALSLKPEELRQEYVNASQFGIPAILGNAPAAKALGAAVAQFVAKPGRLTVSARTKSAAGLGFAEFGTARSPAAVLDKLDVTARAE